MLGRLEEFSFPEVLQIISNGKRTGMLSLISRLGTARISFHAGRVVYASSDGARRLGTHLVSTGILADDDLRRALTEQKSSSPRQALGTIFLQMGLLTQDELERELREHVTRVIHNLLSWEEGLFYFTPHPIDPAQSLLHHGINTQFILLEASRLHDEKPGEEVSDLELWP